jgi:hypothetical protein
MSNKKLKENKQILYEASFFSEALPFIVIGLTAAVGWAMQKFTAYGKKGTYGISEKVYDAVSDLYKDKEFVKDFVNILKKESNLSDIVAKSQSQFYADAQKRGDKTRRRYEDMQDWQGLIKGNIKGQGFEPDAKRIARDVVKSNGYKKFSKKYEFTPEDDKDMFTIIYYIVTRPDFSDTAEKYLYTAASNNRNVPVPPLPAGSFNMPTGF